MTDPSGHTCSSIIWNTCNFSTDVVHCHADVMDATIINISIKDRMHYH